MTEALRWLFVTGPARAFKRGEATGGRVPWLHLFVMLGLGAAGGMVGGLVGFLQGDAAEGVGAGVTMALSVSAAWFVYVLLFVGVMRLRGHPLESLVGKDWLVRPQRWYDR